ncbi:MAG: hypothetical protein CO113_14880, partial [Elusimicrobia bacterium CG_4_9_14_3_um_filter_62_55]
LTRSSYGKQRGGSFNPANEGVRIDFERNITGAQARLKNVAVHHKDYLAILKKYDGPDTFFYMDPPYPGTYNLHDFGFKEEQFLRAIKGLKAKPHGQGSAPTTRSRPCLIETPPAPYRRTSRTKVPCTK